MSTPKYYRGGTNLTPRLSEVKIDRATGLVLPRRGLSVYDRPEDVARRPGGAHEVTNLPEGLRVVQIGRDPHHEIIPASPMPLDEYAELLKQIVLVPV